MALKPELRALFIEGPTPAQKAKRLVMFGGYATVRVLWRGHREELLRDAGMGKRPWGFWAFEKQLKITPVGERAQLKANRNMELYTCDQERDMVQKRLAAISEEPATRSHTAAWPEKQKAPPNVRYWG